VPERPEIHAAAELFKTLGNASRLRLLALVDERPMTVGALAEAAELSQPLTSQHLRTLRQSGLVRATRRGKEVEYHLADQHVHHVLLDALTHVREPAPAETENPREEAS
jgi:DNA-binding transcriptional ArsR family regulator